jgi:3-oxoacyl-[acyl-carrier protein] reductase
MVGPTQDLLEGRVAVVTGAAQGIGMATARVLCEHGASVVLADLDEGKLGEVAGELGGNALAVPGDLLGAEQPGRVVDAAVDAFGHLDIVVNNAGFHWDAPLHRMTDEQWSLVMDIHATVPFRLLRAAAPHLREPAKQDLANGVERFRKVVNVSSVAALFGNAGAVNYSAAKAASIGLTRALAKEWGPLRINVNAVAFGGIATRFVAPMSDDNVVDLGGAQIPLGVPAAQFARLSGGADLSSRPLYEPQDLPVVPLGRSGTIAEAADSILYLCSPLANYVHGHVLIVSGGIPLGMG